MRVFIADRIRPLVRFQTENVQEWERYVVRVETETHIITVLKVGKDKEKTLITEK